jgi:hypothetical protein
LYLLIISCHAGQTVLYLVMKLIENLYILI